MKIKNKGRFLLAIFCLFLLTAFGIRLGKSEPSNGKTVTVFFQNLPNVSAEEAKTNYQILQERIKVFCKGSRYELEKENGMITFTFPEKRLNYYNTLEVLESYLGMPMNYELGKGEDYRLLWPKDIISMEKGSGKIEGIDSSENTRYIRYQFTDDFLNEVKRIQEGELDTIFLNDQSVYKGYDSGLIGFCMEVVRGKDGAYYEIYENDDMLNGNEDIYIYDMTHEQLSYPYNLYEQKIVNWEDEGDFGEYQKKSDDLDQDAYYLQFACDELWTNDVRRKEENTIKARLDSLKVPYAYGTLEDGGFVLRLKSMPFTKAAMESLADQYNICLRCDNYVFQSGLSDDYSDVQIEWNEENDSFSVMTKEEDMEEILTWMKTSGKPLYFGIAQDHFLGIMESVDQMSSYSFVFKMLEGKERWKDLLEEMIMNPSLNKYYSLDYCKKDSKMNDSSLFAEDSTQEEILTRIGECVEKIDPSASVISGDTVEINLNLKKDEDLPEKTLEITKKILDSLQDIEIPPLYVYPTTLQGAERGWISIDTRDDSGKMKLYVVIYHGEMEPYHNVMKEKIEKDPYWKQYSIEILEENEYY